MASPRYNKETQPDNQAYGLAFAKHCRTLGAAVRNGHIADVHGLWKEARTWRAEQSPDNPDFTKLRSGDADDGLGTPIAAQYGYMADRIVACPRAETKIHRANSIIHSTVSLQQTTTVGGQQLQLTRCDVTTDANHRPAGWTMATAGGSRVEILGRMHHPKSSIINPVWTEAQRIFKLAQVNDLNTSIQLPSTHRSLLGQLGEIHWLLTNAMPDLRGSAAKAEMVVRALAYSLGIELAPFAKGVSPDIESFLRSREEWRDGGYEAMFESAPVHSASGERLAWQGCMQEQAWETVCSTNEAEAISQDPPISSKREKWSLKEELDALDRDGPMESMHGLRPNPLA